VILHVTPQDLPQAPQVDTGESKFGGASAVFDGTDDFLVVFPVATTDFDVTTTSGEKTFECWVYADNIADSFKSIFTNRSYGSSTTGWRLGMSNSDGTNGELQLVLWDDVAQADVVYSTNAISANTWHHIAYVWDGVDNHSIYIDGVKGIDHTASDTSATSYQTFLIGDELGGSGREWSSHIDEVRVSNTARYTANFTPQSQPFVNDASTLLLLHMDGTDGVSAVGNAQVDTAQSQFGGASLLLDGTGDYLAVNLEPNTSLNFADDLTVEMWVRLQNTTQTWHMFAAGNDSEYFGIKNNGGGVYSLNTAISNGPNDFFYNLVIPTAPSADTWYHVAMVKNSTGVKAFFNGDELTTVNNSSGSFSADKGWNDVSFIGRYANNLNANGHIDEVRISNTARYTANFTPSTTPFQNDDNTLLLLHMDGTDGSTVFTDDNGVTPNFDYGNE